MTVSDSEDSAFDNRKLAVTMTCLPRIRYSSGFEAARSVGVLTELLAVRCDRLISSDLIPNSGRAVQTRSGCHGASPFEVRPICEQWPSGQFDLVVFNEIAVLFGEKDIARVMACVFGSTRVGAHVVGVHRRGLANHPLSAERSHQIIGESEDLVSVAHRCEEDVLLDIWERR
jgi:Nodulation protein S (NodS)